MVRTGRFEGEDFTHQPQPGLPPGVTQTDASEQIDTSYPFRVSSATASIPFVPFPAVKNIADKIREILRRGIDHPDKFPHITGISSLIPPAKLCKRETCGWFQNVVMPELIQMALTPGFDINRIGPQVVAWLVSCSRKRFGSLPKKARGAVYVKICCVKVEKLRRLCDAILRDINSSANDRAFAGVQIKAMDDQQLSPDEFRSIVYGGETVQELLTRMRQDYPKLMIFGFELSAWFQVGFVDGKRKSEALAIEGFVLHLLSSMTSETRGSTCLGLMQDGSAFNSVYGGYRPWGNSEGHRLNSEFRNFVKKGGREVASNNQVVANNPIYSPLMREYELRNRYGINIFNETGDPTREATIFETCRHFGHQVGLANLREKRGIFSKANLPEGFASWAHYGYSVGIGKSGGVVEQRTRVAKRKRNTIAKARPCFDQTAKFKWD